MTAEAPAVVLVADIRMEGVWFSVARPSPPFCHAGLAGPLSLCYLLRRGDLWLEVESPGATRVALKAGDIVGLSGLVSHWFKSSPDQATRGAPALSLVDVSSDREGEVELIVGHVPLESLAFTNTVNGAVVIPAAGGGRIGRRIWRAFEAIQDEIADPDLAGGTASVVRRLSETMLINIARWVSATSTADDISPLAGLADIRIMRAIAAAAETPLDPWTVLAMAKIAGMSRTAFAKRFRSLMGVTPLRMVGQLRLRPAAEALAKGRMTVDQAAASAAYGSAAAFIRAFRRTYRVTPGHWRDRYSAASPRATAGAELN
jgi:AraC family transcriptional regulator, alkane utilization regulator